jgi:hypothetical protein
VFNLLRAPAQPMLVVGDEAALKVLTGKVRARVRRRRSR